MFAAGILIILCGIVVTITLWCAYVDFSSVSAKLFTYSGEATVDSVFYYGVSKGLSGLTGAFSVIVLAVSLILGIHLISKSKEN